VILWFALAWAAPATLPMHGRLAGADGVPVDDRVRIVVALYDSAEGATPVWSDTFSVVPQGGSFTADLGSGSLLDTDLFEAHAALWVGVTVADDVEMPRFALGGAPRAARAEYAPDAAAVGDRTLDSLHVTTDEVIAAAQAVCLDSTADVRALLDDDYRAIDDPLDWSEIEGVPTVWAAGVDRGVVTKEDVLALIPAGAFDTTQDTLGDAPLGDAIVPDDLTIDGVIRALPASGLLSLPLVVNGHAFQSDHYVVTEPNERVQVFPESWGCDAIEGCNLRLCATTASGGNEGLATCATTRLFLAENRLVECNPISGQCDIYSYEWRVAGGPVYVTRDTTKPPDVWAVGDCRFTDGENYQDGVLVDSNYQRFALWQRPGAPDVVDCVLSIER